jgi:hypothetical protein
MKENIEVNNPEDFRRNNPKKRNINVWGIYISLVFIIIGLIWYGVNVGLIPLTFIQQQAGPIIIILIGLFILLKSLQR